MVGVPRSTGCATCVSRRIKCDEGRPTCQKCEKAGRSCPGYARDLQFRNRTMTVVSRNTRPIVVDSISSASPTDSSSSLGSDSSDLRRDSVVATTPPEVDSVKSLHLPRTEQLQIMSALIDGFAPPSAEPTQGPSMIRDWLSFVYYRIGSTTPLDLAMRSVACMQFGLRTKDTNMINVSRGYYGYALQTLRKALMAPATAQSELQSTVMLLTFYELMSNRKEDEWVRHSGGSVEMMRVRGPSAYTNRKSFDYSMYLVCRYYIVMEAFYKRKACFLDSPEWNTLARDPDSAEGDIRESMFRIHVQIPGLIRNAQRTAAGQYDAFELIKKTVELRTTVKQLYDQWIVELIATNNMPTEVPGEDELFPMVYHFNNLAVHGFMSQHCSTIIQLNSVLIQCGLPGKEEYIQECREQAEQLCRYVQFAQGRVLGSILLHFWLITAKRHAEDKYQDWISAKQAAIQK
ncbi:hypothetical protein AUEXF2481DRAFT_40910 [Aureobasidium subglaciale EXF-2481]|uniref:Zn(2)-C6 fungal-type domain-containing protein n=1 Tax=Aureobasidium subglaciale (strain EXF-2481) TaxID=1043005 RepID=A0A074Y996_AURSE|nr:uncharacterized protein AUEXF2481DRAFT_40910 [Aureobasidium subglaciale EXF-2481]KEQ94330.1 hypothetical protein AUEXF2481DRAFT_40910 [Aureobasidium subglaciale EXF-2481]